MGLANFPSPEIAIKCGIVVIPEPCPEPVCVTMNGCESTLEFDAGYISQLAWAHTQGRRYAYERMSKQARCFGGDS